MTVVPAHVLACAASEGLEILFLVSLLSPLLSRTSWASSGVGVAYHVRHAMIENVYLEAQGGRRSKKCHPTKVDGF